MAHNTDWKFIAIEDDGKPNECSVASNFAVGIALTDLLPGDYVDDKKFVYHSDFIVHEFSRSL